MNKVRTFFIAWAFFNGIVCALVMAFAAFYWLGRLAIMIHPTYGPTVFIVIMVTGSIAALVACTSDEKVGGAPY
ncbi:hypothetical protein [Cytobacillus purgationiresistens]|uniref:Pheromone shutdown protein TraB n=1 Tax=Cytobacillus purgationiresistens TaxID=863449 RepID=A0ABU0AHQ6_9BACI|nr:hypothetical protein [Cytobacillus purgationiresistens]MDQ0270790.1 pheromone shutdown protein TraB [Cytobacillus purgationiresistens]